MHKLAKIEGAATVLRRVDAVLAMMLQLGPDADLFTVMEANGLVRDEVGRALSILEDEDHAESAQSEGEIGEPQAGSPSAAPAHGGAAVVSIRPAQRG